MGLVASVCQPSTLRMLIWPEASNAQNSMAAVSADGSTVCVLIRRLNSSCSRSMALVVRTLRHWLGGSRVKVKSRSPASCRLSATARCLSRHLRMKALRCRSPLGVTSSDGVDGRERIRAALAKEGLSYSRGGHIHGAALSGPSRSLAERIKAGGIPAIEIEYERAYKTIECDPGAAVTAACAILESVCKCYLETEGH